MDRAASEALTQLIATSQPPPIEIADTSRCSGGCIHQAEIVTLSDGRRFFVKSGRGAADMFAQEALGLEALRAANCLRVPQVVAAGMLDGQRACLVLEAINQVPRGDDFWGEFGRSFAELHRHATAESYGWSADNYLGTTRQPNDPSSDWVQFFRDNRLGYQFKLARQGGHGSGEFFQRADRLLKRLDTLLGTPTEPPSLLHGDLWCGNFMADEHGRPTIFDPATYYGRREADLAMPYLFGGFQTWFFEAYRETWPLEPEWSDRLEIYKLYHLLNHLNLFGTGYLESCLDVLRRFT